MVTFALPGCLHLKMMHNCIFGCRFLAADVLEQLGGVAEASAELVCEHVEAYLKDLRYMAEHDDVKADSSDPGRRCCSQQFQSSHPTCLTVRLTFRPAVKAACFGRSRDVSCMAYT